MGGRRGGTVGTKVVGGGVVGEADVVLLRVLEGVLLLLLLW